MQALVPVEISFCVVNTDQRGLLRYCLDAIARERATVDFEIEVLVLDNASRDGSADAARGHPVTTDVIELPARAPTPNNDNALLRHAGGRYCLLLNEDSELEPGATVALHAALAATPGAGAATPMLVSSDGRQQPSAWRLYGRWGRFGVQSRGTEVREVDWARSTALLVRREAADGIGGYDTRLPPQQSAIDFCRRLRKAGWTTLYVPGARAVHEDHPPPQR
jgi:N-acetylglucosaminyl-diphospho-decaprenol L-rhamnosyltransferase